MRRKVVVWRETLLPPSETFIRNQVDSLNHWDGLLCGLRQHPNSISNPSNQMVLYPDNKASQKRSLLRLRMLQLTGQSNQLEKLLKSAAPSLLHAHFGTDAGLIVRSATKIGVPIVTTFHGQDATVDRRPLRQQIIASRIPRVFDESRVLIAVSNFIADKLVTHGAPAEKIEVMPIGIPVPPYHPQLERSGILFVGRLVEKKGAPDLLRAVARLPSPLHRTMVTIIGDGPQRGYLERLSIELNLNARFIGTRSSSDIVGAMWSARLLCVPSRKARNGDSEGLGMVFLEASSCELPVVSYRHGGIPEAVVDKETGLLALEGSIDELSDRLHAVLTDDDLANRLGKAGRNRVKARYSIRTCTAALEGLYDRVAAGTP